MNKAEALLAKAGRAYSSARALLGLGDVDGAANRAYYAMFDAARAALLAAGVPMLEPDIGRTHSGLIGAFGNYLVKNGPVSKDMGRLLNRAHEIRQIADYNGESVELADAQEMVEQAGAFIAAMQAEFMIGNSNDNGYGVEA
ncbi:MAG: HEPN domain-containing protein [Proteobacteria bacterium]|nr:HEPN domain-containing protein [Pseudomonadota bacterium]